MPGIAKHVEIIRGQVFIDGTEFPFYLAHPTNDPTTVRMDDHISVVFLPVLAEDVTLINSDSEDTSA